MEKIRIPIASYKVASFVHRISCVPSSLGGVVQDGHLGRLYGVHAPTHPPSQVVGPAPKFAVVIIDCQRNARRAYDPFRIPIRFKCGQKADSATIGGDRPCHWQEQP